MKHTLDLWVAMINSRCYVYVMVKEQKPSKLGVLMFFFDRACFLQRPPTVIASKATYL